MIHVANTQSFKSAFIANPLKTYINIGNEHYLSLCHEHQGQALIRVDGLWSVSSQLLSVQSSEELTARSREEGMQWALVCAIGFRKAAQSRFQFRFGHIFTVLELLMCSQGSPRILVYELLSCMWGRRWGAMQVVFGKASQVQCRAALRWSLLGLFPDTGWKWRFLKCSSGGLQVKLPFGYISSACPYLVASVSVELLQFLY